MKTNWGETKEECQKQVWLQVREQVRWQVQGQMFPRIRVLFDDQVLLQIGWQVDEAGWRQVLQAINQNLTNK